MKKKAKGFTLIELMITVLIVGIIGSFAVPSYRDYVLRADNANVMAALSANKLKMEQYYQDNRTYVGACDSNSEPPLKMLKISLFPGNVTDNSYTLNASGNGFSFSINEDNSKSTDAAPNGWPTNDSCWIIHKNGTCQ